MSKKYYSETVLGLVLEVKLDGHNDLAARLAGISWCTSLGWNQEGTVLGTRL